MPKPSSASSEIQHPEPTSPAAVAVHVFTASGAAVGLLALLMVFEGRFASSFALLGLALLIDGLDGTFARRFDVARRASFIDGVLLDLVVDFLTYVVVPVVALWRSDLMPQPLALGCGLVIVTASALYFADRRMKTADLWFRGFPACWNVVIFYLFVFRPPATVSAALCALFCALMFAPIVSVHPMRVTRLRPLTIAMTAVWFASAGLAIASGLDGSFLARLGLAATALYFAILPFARGLGLGRRSGKAG